MIIFSRLLIENLYFLPYDLSLLAASLAASQ